MQWNWDITEKLTNSTNAGGDCAVWCSRTSRLGSIYHAVTEYQIWFPFVKGLVGNIFLDDKSLIPISLAHHLMKYVMISGQIWRLGISPLPLPPSLMTNSCCGGPKYWHCPCGSAPLHKFKTQHVTGTKGTHPWLVELCLHISQLVVFSCRSQWLSLMN